MRYSMLASPDFPSGRMSDHPRKSVDDFLAEDEVRTWTESGNFERLSTVPSHGPELPGMVLVRLRADGDFPDGSVYALAIAWFESVDEVTRIQKA